MRAVDPNLFEAIRLFPEADGPRIRLAEAFDAIGDPMGKLIRIQLRRHQHLRVPLAARDDAWDATLDTLEQSQRDVLGEYGPSWASSLGVPLGSVFWDRGEICLELTWAQWSELAETVIARAPVQSLKIVDEGSTKERKALAQGFSATHALSTVRRLSFSGGRLQQTALASILGEEGPITSEIDLSYCSLAHGAVASLFRWPGVANLVSLDLRGNRVSDANARLLASRVAQKHIKSLALQRSSLSQTGLATLLQSENLSCLRELSLIQSHLTSDWLIPWLDAPLFSNLESLDLSYNLLDDGVVAPLVGAGPQRALVELNLNNNALRDDSYNDLSRIDRVAGALAASSSLEQLSRLGLASSSISPDAFETLLRSPNLPSLRSLDIGGGWRRRDRQAALDGIFSSTLGAKLREVALDGVGLDSESAKQLLTSPMRPNLRSLSLRSCFDSATLVALFERDDWSRLRHLDLRDTFVDERAARAIARNPSLHKLHKLWMTKKVPTSEAETILSKVLPWAISLVDSDAPV